MLDFSVQPSAKNSKNSCASLPTKKEQQACVRKAMGGGGGVNPVIAW